MKTKLFLAAVFAVAGLFHPAFGQEADPDNDRLSYRHYPRYYYSNADRNPKFTFVFNEEVPSLRLRRELFFEDADEKAVPAKVRQSNEQEIHSFWRYYGGSNQESPPANQFVTVEPSRPLPVGRNWKLILPEKLKSKSGKKVLPKRAYINAGTVREFKVDNAIAYSRYNEKTRISLSLSKPLEMEQKRMLDRYISLTPAPENFKMTDSGRSVSLNGDFVYGTKYKLFIRAGLLAADGLELEKPFEKELQFVPKDGFVTLPDFSVAQPKTGEGTFKILTGNLENIEVKIKRLDGPNLVYALRGYKVYSERYPAFEMVPGKTIFDKKFKPTVGIDSSESLELKWSEILGENQAAALYISVEGYGRDHKHLRYHRVGAQSIIQLTDLGLVWKKNKKETQAYAFSLSTGKPIVGAQLSLFDKENQLVSTVYTDGTGLAKFGLTDKNAESAWLVTSKGTDRYAAEFDPTSNNGLSTWRFNIRTPYWSEPDVRLRSYLFSDRGIYKPGETVHLKAVARLADGEALQIPGKKPEFPAKLIVKDGRNRVVLNRDVTFTQRGTLDVSFPVPANNVGTYRAIIDFEPVLGKGQRMPYDDEDEERDHYDRFAYHYFTVADYRPNTFEVSLTGPSVFANDAEIQLDAQANYYRGKPLSKAQLRWHASYYGATFQPKGFAGFVFGANDSRINGHEAGEMQLGEAGDANLDLNFIPTDSLEQPVRVNVGADITDINQQTISKSSNFLVHSSDFYLGMKMPEGWTNTGEEMSVSMLAVSKDSELITDEIEATLTVEHKTFNTIKVKGAGGSVRHKNEWRYNPVAVETVLVKATDPKNPFAKKFTLEKPGQYRFTLETTDPEGKRIHTVREKYIYGNGDVYWARRDGDAIELVPNQTAYVVGDTAKIMVRSPILGNALITTERAGVYKTISRELTSKSELIELPIEAGDAPNVFVSVLVVRGGEKSPHKFKDTDYKLGYCELKVTEPNNKLNVTIEVAQNEILPQQQVDLTTTVKSLAGTPLPNTEVTLYAVDEGVLSLTSYETPDPSDEFHRPYPLYIKTWHTLFNVMTEDPEKREYSNKGLMIGGGGSGLGPSNTRKDFRATAFWNGSLITDANGQVKVNFSAPDNLTEYRLIAVALGDNLDQYGAGTSKMVVSKPIIMEPALPAFANLGDDLLLQAVLHNTTDKPGQFEITIETDGKIKFLGEEFKITPAAFTPLPNNPKIWRDTIELAAQTSEALPVPVRFTQTGEAKWKWSIREVGNSEAKRADSIETKFKIGYPVPLLGETRSFKIKPGETQNLLASFNGHMLNGVGDVDITISNTRLLEAQDALEYNMRYPYGCAEQTTSSTLPWMTLNSLEKVFPELSKDPERKAKAINYGLNRLLTMQTHGGGLGYWPGANEPSFWGSAWGGLALALGKKQGVELPEARLESLWEWLSETVRDDSEDIRSDAAYKLHQRCVALYTLALAGKAEPAYHEVYFAKRDQLAPESRAVLAMAILESEAAEQRKLVSQLLAPNPKAPDHARSWYGPAMPIAMELMARLAMDPSSDQVGALVDKMLRHKKAGNGWGSTYSNAWPLLALSQVAQFEARPAGNGNCRVAFGGDAAEVQLGQAFESKSTQFGFDGDVSANKLDFTATGQTMFANVSLRTRPADISAKAQNRGFEIGREYFRLDPDGTLTATNNFTVGDLVVIELRAKIENQNETYLAIDDPLPAVLEAVNPAFKNRANAKAPLNKWKQLYRHYEEIRTDRALFFCDRVHDKGEYRVQYLARVVAAGIATAPPAKIEAMYEPQRNGLTATQRITVRLPQPEAKVASR